MTGRLDKVFALQAILSNPANAGATGGGGIAVWGTIVLSWDRIASLGETWERKYAANGSTEKRHCTAAAIKQVLWRLTRPEVARISAGQAEIVVLSNCGLYCIVSSWGKSMTGGEDEEECTFGSGIS